MMQCAALDCEKCRINKGKKYVTESEAQIIIAMTVGGMSVLGILRSNGAPPQSFLSGQGTVSSHHVETRIVSMDLGRPSRKHR